MKYIFKHFLQKQIPRSKHFCYNHSQIPKQNLTFSHNIVYYFRKRKGFAMKQNTIKNILITATMTFLAPL
ncbi:hypothetical protein DMB91_02300 [Campylobacter sp. MIT 97-5078]|nr:hypothetical protein LR59_07950 [Campylobacter sp. MIT 97-5078]TQR27765.1 hypothetical protein DMB91_02300 [Campylobacter sp. MIT 97-5078]